MYTYTPIRIHIYTPTYTSIKLQTYANLHIYTYKTIHINIYIPKCRLLFIEPNAHKLKCTYIALARSFPPLPPPTYYPSLNHAMQPILHPTLHPFAPFVQYQNKLAFKLIKIEKKLKIKYF